MNYPAIVTYVGRSDDGRHICLLTWKVYANGSSILIRSQP